MRAARRRPSTTEHGHAVSTRGYQSDPWSEERPRCSAPRSPPARTYHRALTEVTPYQEAEARLSWFRHPAAGFGPARANPYADSVPRSVRGRSV